MGFCVRFRGAALAALSAAACASVPASGPAAGAATALPAAAAAATTATPPLAVWDVAAGVWLPDVELWARLVTADVVLIGEIHDNPGHHRTQAQLLAGLAARGRRPRVVMEALPAGTTAPTASAPTTAALAAVRTELDWDASGWPPWPLYAPIFAAAAAHDLHVVGGDLPRAAVRAAMRGEGAIAVPGAAGVDAALPAAADAALAAELAGAHCQPPPPAVVTKMAAIQRARDLSLAVAVAAERPAVLLAGNGHVQRRYGVPLQLAKLAPNARAVVVGQLETGAGGVPAPADALAAELAAGAGYDLLTFAPAPERSDPCAP